MLAGMLLLLQTGLIVTTEVDRDRVAIGDEVHYTLRASSTVRGSFRIDLPDVRGFDVVERTELADEAATSVGVHGYQIDITFRANEVGAWRLGPAMVFHEAEIGVGAEVLVMVVGNPANDPTNNARLLGLIRQVASPAPGVAAALVTVVSSPRVFQGGQLDVLTAAWFSRSLRGRLRRPPTLKPPVLAGVWTVPQPAVPGIIASRTVGEDVYDLFVSHQVAFPLTAGPLVIPAARLEYAVPLTRRASGDERPEATTSAPVTVQVDALPDAERPDGFRGPTGRSLRVGYRVRELPGHSGEPLPIDISVQGLGNLTFWGPPSVTWPPGMRAYLDRTSEAQKSEAGVLGGTKTFHFLLVPDSVGSVALPAIAYQYFDEGGRTYRTAETAELVVPILPGQSKVAGRVPPPLAVATSWGWIRFLEPGRPAWIALVFAPLGILLLAAGWIQRSRRPQVRAPKRADGAAALETLISRLVPEADRGEAVALARGLRRAGVPRTEAAIAAQLKLDIDRLRFTPGDSTGVVSLGKQALVTIAAIPERVRQRGGLLLVLVAASVAFGTQEETAVSRYRQGAYRPAAVAFEQRAALEPERWDHWYNAAAARFLAGDDGAAAARLTRALAVAPRAAPARTLWNLLERQYEPLRSTRPRGGLSSGEIGLAALMVWWVAAGLLFAGRRSKRALISAATLGVLPLLAAIALTRPPGAARAFVASATSLRRSPHGLSPEEGKMPALTRVTIAQRRGDWVLVEDRLGNRGWISQVSLAPIDQVN